MVLKSNIMKEISISLTSESRNWLNKCLFTNRKFNNSGNSKVAHRQIMKAKLINSIWESANLPNKSQLMRQRSNSWDSKKQAQDQPIMKARSIIWMSQLTSTNNKFPNLLSKLTSINQESQFWSKSHPETQKKAQEQVPAHAVMPNSTNCEPNWAVWVTSCNNTKNTSSNTRGHSLSTRARSLLYSKWTGNCKKGFRSRAKNKWHHQRITTRDGYWKRANWALRWSFCCKKSTVWNKSSKNCQWSQKSCTRTCWRQRITLKKSSCNWRRTTWSKTFLRTLCKKWPTWSNKTSSTASWSKSCNLALVWDRSAPCHKTSTTVESGKGTWELSFCWRKSTEWTKRRTRSGTTFCRRRTSLSSCNRLSRNAKPLFHLRSRIRSSTCRMRITGSICWLKIISVRSSIWR